MYSLSFFAFFWLFYAFLILDSCIDFLFCIIVSHSQPVYLYAMKGFLGPSNIKSSQVAFLCVRAFSIINQVKSQVAFSCGGMFKSCHGWDMQQEERSIVLCAVEFSHRMCL
jgi:hypothetical protein